MTKNNFEALRGHLKNIEKALEPAFKIINNERNRERAVARKKKAAGRKKTGK